MKNLICIAYAFSEYCRGTDFLILELEKLANVRCFLTNYGQGTDKDLEKQNLPHNLKTMINLFSLQSIPN